MSTGKQLRLVTEPPPAHDAHEASAARPPADPTRRVFEHWVFMFGLNAKRTKLDAERRQVINAALALYEGDVDEILRAVEGMAAVPLGDKPQSMQDAMREVTWFLAKASRIEAALRYSDQLHEALRAAALPAAMAAQAPEVDAAAAHAARERLRALAAQYRGTRG